MTKRCLLLVDGDEKSLRVLEVSLKKAGFNILTANTGIEALQKAADYSPDLVISDTEMEEMDGYAFCKEFKQNPNWADVPFVFLTKESSIENKIKGLELGVDDYLTKPIYIKEILTRVRILLQKRERSNLELKKEHNTRFAGQLNDMGVVDLIQTIEVSRKTGIIYFRQDEKRQATIFFKDGKVIDAETGHLQGEEAVYRILTWNDGEFEALFRPIRRKDTIEMSSQALLMEGMRRLDDWGRLQEQLPPLDKKFEIVYDELWERLSELPDNLNAVLRLFDTRKTLNEVIDGSSMGDLEVVEIISKLYFEGIIAEVGKTPKPTTEIEAQLGNDQPGNDQPGNSNESGDDQEPDPITAVAYDPTTDLDESDEEGDTPMGSDLDLAAAAAVAVAASDTGRIISEGDTLRDVNASSVGGNESTTTDILDKAITAATPIDKSHSGTTTLSGAPVAAVRLVKKVSKTLPFAVVEIQRQKPAEEESPEPDQDAGKLSEEVAAERPDDGTGIEEENSDSVAQASEATDSSDLTSSGDATTACEEVLAGDEDEVASDSPDSAEDSNSTTHESGDSESGESKDDSNNGDSEDESGDSDNGDSEDESGDSEDESEDDDSASGEPESNESEDSGSESDSLVSESDSEADDSGGPSSEGEGQTIEMDADYDDEAEQTPVAPLRPELDSSREQMSVSGSVSISSKTVDQPENAEVSEPTSKVETDADESEDAATVSGSDSEAEPATETTGPVHAKEEEKRKIPLWFVGAGVAAAGLAFVLVSQGNSSQADSQEKTGRASISKTVDDSQVPSLAVANPIVLDGGITASPVDARIAGRTSDARIAMVAADARTAIVQADASTKVVAPTPPDNKPDTNLDREAEVQLLIKSARRAKQAGDRFEALQIIDDSLALRKSSTALLFKAELLLEIGDSKSAASAVEELTRVASKRPVVWRLKGHVAVRNGKKAEARSAYAKYLEMAPSAKDAASIRRILENL